MSFRLNHRCDITNAATREIEAAYLAIADKYNLTHAEIAAILNLQCVAATLKYPGILSRGQ